MAHKMSLSSLLFNISPQKYYVLSLCKRIFVLPFVLSKLELFLIFTQKNVSKRKNNIYRSYRANSQT